MDKKTLQAVLSHPTTRRQFFSAAGMTSALVLTGEIAAEAQVGTSAKLPAFPFTLGVASGDPTPGGIVLWTRLLPNPALGAWNSARSRSVQYQVATTPNFGTLVRQGTSLALPQEAHSVHVELSGLQPGATYFYRFLIDGYVSRVGRFKTAPALQAVAGTPLVKFAFCSCSDYQNGFFAAYRAMADEDIDFFVHLGDYIYEYDADPTAPGGRQHTATDLVQSTGTGNAQLFSLSDYRNRHAQYKQDAALQQLHATHPMIAVWDDHETENNYGQDRDEIGDRLAGGNRLQTPGAAGTFLLERAAAYQAWYEHMPVRRSFIVRETSGAPRWRDANLYRRLVFGNLMTLHMLDTRQYRTDQPRQFGTSGTPLGDLQNFLAVQDFGLTPPLDGNPNGTLLGATQKQWLLGGLQASTTKWNVLGQQVMMALNNFNSNFDGTPPNTINGVPAPVFNVDQWDGYATERGQLLGTVSQLIAAQRNPNLVVLTGDIHSAWAHDLKFAGTPAQWASQPAVATEFVCSSISADFPAVFWEAAEASPTRQPWNKYINPRQRGYVRCTVTPGAFVADFRVVDSNPTTGQVLSGTAVVSTAASFQTLDGAPGAIPA